ncbi:MAG: hypothetical protein ABIP71_04460, partial [Verrucomicrobiota bacterium]
MKTPPMKTPEKNMRAVLSDCSRKLFLGVTLFAMLAGASTVQSQTATPTDNFNDADDGTANPARSQGIWSRYAPLNQAPLPPDNEVVSWTFPADPLGGFYYRIFGGVPGGAL